MDDVGDRRARRGSPRPRRRSVMSPVDDVDGRELVGRHDLGAAGACRCRGRTPMTGAALADERPDRPGADAAHRAGDEEALPRRAHETAAAGATRRGRARGGTCCVSRPMPLDLDRHHVAVGEQDRRVAEDPDAARRPGRDDVAGLQGERLEQWLMISATPKYICAVLACCRTSSLTRHSIVERLRVGDLVGGHERRAHRAERVERLAAGPLAVAELEVARRDVVEAGVAEDVVEGVAPPTRGARGGR